MTPPLNPNAPRIDFFRPDSDTVAPGSTVTLFWSTRNVTNQPGNIMIYQLNRQGERERLWSQQDSDGTLNISTRESDRGQLDFLLVVRQGEFITEQRLSIPLLCPVRWFFEPGPRECPNTEPQDVGIVQQTFERGRMVYLKEENIVYALFNDGQSPAWVSFANTYDAAVHSESEEGFIPPPGFYQPIAELGFIWRRETVRTRLGLGIEPELPYTGFAQTVTLTDGSQSLYLSSTDATVLQLIPGGSAWEIITLP